MSEQERLQEVLKFYNQERVKDQRAFYDSRARLYRRRDRSLRVTAGVLMLSTGLVATIDALVVEATDPVRLLVGLLPTIIPALATGLLTMRGILQFENTQYLYAQTYFKVGDIDVEAQPDPDDPELEDKLRRYIEQVESAIANENVQWLSRESEVRTAQPPQS